MRTYHRLGLLAAGFTLLAATFVVLAPAAGAWHGELTSTVSCVGGESVATWTITEPGDTSWNPNKANAFLLADSVGPGTQHAFVKDEVVLFDNSTSSLPYTITGPTTVSVGLGWDNSTETWSGSDTAAPLPSCGGTTTTTEQSTTTTQQSTTTTAPVTTTSEATTTTQEQTTTTTAPATTTSTAPTTTSTIPETTTTVQKCDSSTTTSTIKECGTTTTVQLHCVPPAGQVACSTTTVPGKSSTTPPVPPASLPRTGTNSALLFAIGLGLVGAGCLLLAAKDKLTKA